MTLRMTLEIVPFGDETKKRSIKTINISNIGNIGLGVCKYAIEVDKYKQLDESNLIVEHSRADGAETLVKKVLEKLGY